MDLLLWENRASLISTGTVLWCCGGVQFRIWILISNFTVLVPGTAWPGLVPDQYTSTVQYQVWKMLVKTGTVWTPVYLVYIDFKIFSRRAKAKQFQKLSAFLIPIFGNVDGACHE